MLTWLGISNSFVNNFTPSASGCKIPYIPTTFGPFLLWLYPSIFLSAKVRYATDIRIGTNKSKEWIIVYTIVFIIINYDGKQIINEPINPISSNMVTNIKPYRYWVYITELNVWKLSNWHNLSVNEKWFVSAIVSTSMRLYSVYIVIIRINVGKWRFCKLIVVCCINMIVNKNRIAIAPTYITNNIRGMNSIFMLNSKNETNMKLNTSITIAVIVCLVIISLIMRIGNNNKNIFVIRGIFVILCLK